ncbi:MAG: hypothetical protein GX628_08970 [Clostridiales bacterium]|nr:hypothetical protein [Clostridiales bacterium]
MMASFSAALGQMAVLFSFMLCGYIFNKLKITPPETSQVLSKLEMYIFLPCLCYRTLSGSFTREVLGSKLKLILSACVLFAAVVAVSLIIVRFFSKDKMQRAIYLYGFIIPNMGYMGYPLVEAVFGAEVLADFMVFATPFNIFIYTAGIWMLNPNRTWSVKSLLNPTLIALFLGVAAGLTGLRLPAFMDTAIASAAACMSPTAMLLTGFVLARAPLGAMFKNPKTYIASFIRLVAFPAVFGGLMLLLRVPDYTALLGICLLALPIGLNNVVFPESFGVDSTAGAQLCLMANIMGVITIPLIYSLVGTLAG